LKYYFNQTKNKNKKMRKLKNIFKNNKRFYQEMITNVLHHQTPIESKHLKYPTLQHFSIDLKDHPLIDDLFRSYLALMHHGLLYYQDYMHTIKAQNNNAMDKTVRMLDVERLRKLPINKDGEFVEYFGQEYNERKNYKIKKMNSEYYIFKTESARNFPSFMPPLEDPHLRDYIYDSKKIYK
jgi:hypothetical protein